MTNLDWRINYANGLLIKLEAVKKKVGGGKNHDVQCWIGILNQGIMLAERDPSRLERFGSAIEECERFLASIVVPQTSTETRRGFMSQLWRTNE